MPPVMGCTTFHVIPRFSNARAGVFFCNKNAHEVVMSIAPYLQVWRYGMFHPRLQSGISAPTPYLPFRFMIARQRYKKYLYKTVLLYYKAYFT